MVLIVAVIFKLAQFLSNKVFNYGSGPSLLISLFILFISVVAIYEVIRYFLIQVFSKEHKGK